MWVLRHNDMRLGSGSGARSSSCLDDEDDEDGGGWWWLVVVKVAVKVVGSTRHGRVTDHGHISALTGS